MAAHLSIVLVEDNDDLRELTADALRDEGHRVVALSCAEELEDQARGAAADVFLIDLNLPGEDGFSLSRRIRQVHPLVGIVIISARSDLQDKVVGYDSGADWYLPKPVPFAELSAALKSFARRRQAQQVDTVMPSGGLRLQQRELHGPVASVRLTPAEENLLTALARAPSGRLENWQLLELFGLDSADVSKTSLEVRITRLRKKLSQVGAQGLCLESIRGIGYQLNVPVQVMV
ncbi:response regulator transcription factor [Limnohabitans sp.]|uniref:response regulator transcription factor n=1 Tax=Limnohabitans sp. TaxID=1907725 RepID=UPI002AFFE94B|nr:response regulator transcription factor [Limnohabitans sp.]